MLRALFPALATSLLLAGAAPGAEPATAAAQSVPANPMGLVIDHQTLGVADIGKEAEWYRRVMGFQVGPLNHRPTYDVQQLSIPGFYLGLLAQKDSIRPTPTMDSGKQGALGLTFGTKDAEAAYKHLVALGIEVRATRDAQGKLSGLHFADPEGNPLEVSQR